MRTLYQILIPLLTLAFVAGCGRAEAADAFEGMSESEVYELREPGKATGELEVRIKIEAEPEVDNTQDPDEFETGLEVYVARNGEAVRDAVVTVLAYEGSKIRLDFDEVDDGFGEYKKEIKGYHRAYRVDVEAGDDRLEGAYLAGPAIHRFTNPEEDDVIAAGEDLELRWEADDGGADGASLEGDGFEEFEIDDEGSHRVKAAKLDDDDEDEFELKRWNEMKLPDLGGSSTFRVGIKNEVEVKLESVAANAHFLLDEPAGAKWLFNARLLPASWAGAM